LKTKDIVVIGSINMDLVVKASRFPRPDETMAGETFYTSYGGKGANQAVTAARLGAPVSFVGCVGDDRFGEEMTQHLRDEGVNTSCVRQVSNCSSGTALIIVDSVGRNQIIVVRGANKELNAEDIRCAQPLIASAELVVIQLEIPRPTVHCAVETARKSNVPVILNPAPAPAGPFDPGLLEQVHILVPNELEAEALTGLDPQSPDFPEKALQALRKQGAEKVIITLGDRGAVFSDEDKIQCATAYTVRAEDTTGAGDAFVGALAAGYSFFPSFAKLIRFASAVAAISVTRRGAQSSLPARAEVQTFLENHEPSLLPDFCAMETRNIEREKK